MRPYTPWYVMLAIIGLYLAGWWWIRYRDRRILDETWMQDKVPYPTEALEEVVRRAHEQDEEKS